MTESITGRVSVAAAIKRATTPHQAPERRCAVCEEPLPAGIVRHPQCRGWNLT